MHRNITAESQDMTHDDQNHDTETQDIGEKTLYEVDLTGDANRSPNLNTRNAFSPPSACLTIWSLGVPVATLLIHGFLYFSVIEGSVKPNAIAMIIIFVVAAAISTLWLTQLERERYKIHPVLTYYIRLISLSTLTSFALGAVVLLLVQIFDIRLSNFYSMFSSIGALLTIAACVLLAQLYRRRDR